MNFETIANRMFRKVENVVIDATTMQMAVRNKDSLISLVEEGSSFSIVENILGEEMGFDIPAFATAKHISQIQKGDLIANPEGKAIGWVISMTAKTIKVLTTKGTHISIQPSQSTMMPNQTALVVSSLMNHTDGQMNPMMMMALMGDDVDKEKLLPLILMMSGTNQNQMNPMMLMTMMGGDDVDTKTLAMMSMMSNQGGDQGQMNPMMMMALMGDKVDTKTLAMMSMMTTGQGCQDQVNPMMNMLMMSSLLKK